MPGRVNSPACRLPDFRRRSGCVPAEPYPPLKRPRILQTKNLLTIGPEHYSAFVRTDLSGFDRTTTEPLDTLTGQTHLRFWVSDEAEV